MRGQIRNNGIIGKLQDVHVIPRVSTFRGSIGKNPVCFTNIESMALLIALSEFPYGMGGDFDNCEWEMGAQSNISVLLLDLVLLETPSNNIECCC